MVPGPFAWTAGTVCRVGAATTRWRRASAPRSADREGGDEPTAVEAFEPDGQGPDAAVRDDDRAGLDDPVGRFAHAHATHDRGSSWPGGPAPTGDHGLPGDDRVDGRGRVPDELWRGALPRDHLDDGLGEASHQWRRLGQLARAGGL